jgi:hypothetical protein
MRRLSYEAKYWDFSTARRMTQEERDSWLEQQTAWHELLEHETGRQSKAFKGVKCENPKMLLSS